MLKFIKKYLISLTGILFIPLIYGITALYKSFFYTGFEGWIVFMHIKVYSSGLLFSLLFISLFSFSVQKIKPLRMLLFVFLNGLIYVFLVLLISDRLPVFPENSLMDDMRLMLFTSVGACFFFFLLSRISNIWFSSREYLLIAVLGLLPSLFQVIVHHGMNNTDRGQNIMLPWQILIPIGINFLLLLHRKRATAVVSNVA